jgi:tetratricopeptide (TPR) repeat protein
MSETDKAALAAPPSPLAGAWFALALAALGLSALFAVFLVIARTPFLGQGAAVFRTALVLHVDLAVLVWFLALAAGAWALAATAAGAWHWTAFGLATLGALAMLAATAASDALPILANYVPLLDHPLYLAGLALFALAIAASGLLALPGIWRSTQPWRRAALLSVAALLVAMTVLAIDLTTTASIDPVSIDSLLWGAGHSLQFVHILLLMAAWLVLGQAAAAKLPRLQHALPWLYGLAFLPVLLAPLIALTVPVGTVEYRLWFTALMRWGAWPGAALLCLALAFGLLRLRQERRLDDDEKALALSLFLFALGCLLGTTIRGESLAVPAHYHGTVGAITLAYLVWLRRFAGHFGIAAEQLAAARKLPLLYGGGIALLVAGLGAAGYLGIPRKAPHIDLGLDNAGYLAAMGVAGLGGFLALAAVLAIVAFGCRALYRSWRPDSGKGQRDIRPWAIASAILLVVGGGLALEYLPGSTSNGGFSPRRHAAEKIRADIDTRFQQGVMMLHAKQYEHALTAFHRVLQLAPEMPEAYVNMGFALLGLQRYKEARDFFESATVLRRNQVNAYYGLAVALEGMGDLEGAIGAMQAYAHLAKEDDPFRLKAEGALWEWRETLAARAAAGKKPNH